MVLGVQLPDNSNQVVLSVLPGRLHEFVGGDDGQEALGHGRAVECEVRHAVVRVLRGGPERGLLDMEPAEVAEQASTRDSLQRKAQWQP